MARLFDDASSQYLEYAGAVLTAPPITMAAWVYSNDLTLSQDVISITRSDTTGDYFRLNLGGATAGDPVRAISDQGGGGAGIAVTGTGYSVNTWHHACAVFAAVNARAAYIDGLGKGTNATSKTPSGVALTEVGRHIQSGGGLAYFSGLIAEVAIWNAALTDDEVAALARRRLCPLLVRPQNLVDYYPLFGNVSPEPDFRSRRYSMQVNGAKRAEHPPGIVYPDDNYGLTAWQQEYYAHEPAMPWLPKRRYYYSTLVTTTTTVGAIKVRNTTPSISGRYARSKSESARPDLWPDLGLWAPALGPTGQTLYDVSNRGLSFPIGNDPVWRSGYLDFGGNSHLTAGTLGPFGWTGALTVVACISPRLATDVTNRGIASRWVGAGNLRVWNLYVDYQTSPGVAAYYSFAVSPDGTTPSSAIARSAITVEANSWSIVAGVFRPNTAVEIWVNGILDGSDTTSVPSSAYDSTTPLRIGTQYDPTDVRYNLQGKMSYVSVFRYALPASVIRDLAAAPLAPLRLRRQVYYSLPAAVGPQTGTPDPAVLRLIGADPTASSGVVSVAPDPSVLRLLGVDPVAAPGVAGASPSPAVLRLLGGDPVAAPGVAGVSPAAAVLRVLGVDPTPVPGGISASASAAVLRLLGVSPTTSSGAVSVTPGPAAVRLIVAAAAVAGAVTVSPGPAGVNLVVPDPGTSQTTAVAATAAVLRLLGVAPGALGEATVVPDPAVISLLGVAPEVYFQGLGAPSPAVIRLVAAVAASVGWGPAALSPTRADLDASATEAVLDDSSARAELDASETTAEAD